MSLKRRVVKLEKSTGVDKARDYEARIAELDAEVNDWYVAWVERNGRKPSRRDMPPEIRQKEIRYLQLSAAADPEPSRLRGAPPEELDGILDLMEKRGIWHTTFRIPGGGSSGV